MNEKLRKLEEEFVRVVYGEEVLEEIEKMDAPKRPTEYSKRPNRDKYNDQFGTECKE